MTNKTLINLKNDLVFGDVVPDEKILQRASNLVVYEMELLDQDLLKCVDHYDIITSVNDNRLYRGLEFPHQLKVVLITDPSAEKAAAALRVAAGENYIKDIEGNMDDNIEEQVEEFMLSMKDYINNMFITGMPVEEIEAIKMSITESYHNKKPKTLDDLSNVYWDEITKMECIFNRTDVVLDILKAITLTDLSDFFENLVSKNTPKLVHVSFDAAPTWYMNKSVYTSKRTSRSKRTIKHMNDMLYFYQTQGSYPVKKISIN